MLLGSGYVDNRGSKLSGKKLVNCKYFLLGQVQKESMRSICNVFGYTF